MFVIFNLIITKKPTEFAIFYFPFTKSFCVIAIIRYLLIRKYKYYMYIYDFCIQWPKWRPIWFYHPYQNMSCDTENRTSVIEVDNRTHYKGKSKIEVPRDVRSSKGP